jgi:hypothetical protein
MEETDMGFMKKLSALINEYSLENASDTPDYILARYLSGCLLVFSEAVSARDKWYEEHE